MKRLAVKAFWAMAVLAGVAATPAAGAPKPVNVPELMKTSGGKRVAGVEDWESVRAPEILKTFSTEVFGVRPKAADERARVSFETYGESEAFGGKAVCRKVRVNYDGPGGRHSFPVVAYIPKSDRPVGAFVYAGINFDTKYDADGAIVSSEFWPAERIVSRGYATVAYPVIKVAADSNVGFSQGIFPCVQLESDRNDESWATISAWAWAASRVMDWIETEKAIDAKRVGIVGHSRGGKTAIWTGVTDRRFAMVCSNNSGCSGAKLNHIDLPRSENIRNIMSKFPFWFCGNYRKYIGKDMTMDFDHHQLLALVAPRLLCVTSATNDSWAGQEGEWHAASLASPAWELYGKKGLVADAFPKPETPQQDGCISYHLRSGRHFLAPYDWDRFMDFADRHGWWTPVAGPLPRVEEPSDGTAKSVSLDGSEWIWHRTASNDPGSEARLRASFTLPEKATVAGAMLLFSCDNGAVVKINGREASRQAAGEDDWRKPTFAGDVSKLLRPGVNTVEAECRNEKVFAGFIACLKITLDDGSVHELRTDAMRWTSSRDGAAYARAASGGKHGCSPWGRLAAVTMTPSLRKYPGIDGTLSSWISAADAKEADEACRRQQISAEGTSQFMTEFVNPKEIRKATWAVAGLGVFEVFANGKRIGGEDALKPGFTNSRKTKYYFTYDVTKELDAAAGARNVLQAEVSSGWWRDKIVSYAGKKSAFRAELEIEYVDGTRRVLGTNTSDWKACVGGPVKRAGVFDGEVYDARVKQWSGEFENAVLNEEFTGGIFPSDGAEICRRADLSIAPVEAYCWQGIEGAAKDVFGTVRKTRVFKKGERLSVKPGETLVVDFGQNAAAVPHFTKMTGKEGTVLTCLSGEMLNDGNGERSRGNDGPAGSVYRENLRMQHSGMRVEYTFSAEREAQYFPRFTFFGYRYITVTATDEVSFFVESLPVTSIKREHELGRIETGVKDVNRLISNVYWGQLSNYLSVPTDCPQRNERLGWTADTQVFAEAGTFNADTLSFMRKWMRDMRDSQSATGAFPGVAPWGQYGNEMMRFGWADAGVIVPYQMWKQFGDLRIVRENLAAMEKYVAHCAETKFDYNATRGENGGYQWADWLSYEGVSPGEMPHYWSYLGACYWLWDARMLSEMRAALGLPVDKYEKMAAEAKRYILENFFEGGRFKLEKLNAMQTPALFALHLGLVDGADKARMIENLRRNIKAHGDCLQTGFLGTSILMETLSANGMTDVAYTLLLQHKNPSWLYSVDQGATTIWERWNSYTKEKGFGAKRMNSFNHYAYGAVLSWIYKVAAGISADPVSPGFKNIIMAPRPDRRLGRIDASYRTPYGVVKSQWRYEDDEWIWDFTVPEGATADVTVPGEAVAKRYAAGTYQIRLPEDSPKALRGRIASVSKGIFVGTGAIPGSILVSGSGAAALAYGKAGGAECSVAAAGRMGLGRVVAFGHEGLIAHKENLPVLKECVKWLARGKTPDRIYVDVSMGGLRKAVAAAAGGAETVAVRGYAELDRLPADAVYVVNPDAYSVKDSAMLSFFIRRGGGVLCKNVGWGWKQISGGKSMSKENPLNAAIGESGIYSSDGCVDPAEGGVYPVIGAEGLPGTDGDEALGILEGKAEGLSRQTLARCELLINGLLAAMPENDTTIMPRLSRFIDGSFMNAVPSPRQPLRQDNPGARLALSIHARKWQSDPVRKWPAHPAAAVYPGLPAKGASCTERTVDIDMAVPRWHGTGLFAAAGEPITVTIPESAKALGLGVRIGTTHCCNFRHSTWRRAPLVTVEVPLKETSLTFSSPFGGMVYVTVPHGSVRDGKVSVKIGGAYQAAWYVEGRDTPESWRKALESSTAPMAEIENASVAITVSRDMALKADSPDKILELWRRIVEMDAKFASVKTKREYPERICFDIDLCAGYMHAGYPIMIPEHSMRHLLNLDTVLNYKVDDVWGLFHEMGHNFQSSHWTFDGTGEVTVNFFTLYNLDKVCGIKPRKTEKIGNAGHADKVRKWNEAGRPFEQWKSDPFLALDFFVSLQEKYGWEAFEKLFAEYAAAKPSELPKNDLEKRRQWCERFSRIAGKDLSEEFAFMLK